jgi:glycosyltransferase involved in cell wall biosynthesis
VTLPPDPDRVAKLGDIAANAGIQRVHVLAWRDLDDPEAGGSELHIHEVLRRWAAAGIHVTQRTSYVSGRSPETMRDGYRVIRRAGRYLIFPRAVLAERAGRHGPADALVEIWNGVPFLSPIWFRGRRLVLLHHVHAEMFQMVLPPRLAAAGRFVERRLAPPLYRRTQVATLSRSSQRELVEDLHLRPERVAVVPPGISDAFRPDPTVAKAAHPLIVAVGRLVPVKRYEVLIQAVAEVHEHVPDVELRINGEGSERERLEALIDDLDASGYVHLAGRVDDEELVRSYQEAWIVASSSIREGWGMTLTEAAACGTPAVATDISGHRDAVEHGTTGLLVSDTEMGSALRSVIEDDALRQRLAHGALERAAQLSWDETARGLLTLLAGQALHP